ncbi:MAG: hypothetical protein HUK14_11545 [Muribaculaceae bacterium]|nr:hypothetical protein [Muribaculaceae bacterium]
MTHQELLELLHHAETVSGTATLTETEGNPTLCEVTVEGIPDNSIFYPKIDKARFNNFLRDGLGHDKHGDHMLITKDGIFVFEMKSKMEVNDNLVEECRKKFTSDTCMMAYVDKIFDSIVGQGEFFSTHKICFVLLYQATDIAIAGVGINPYVKVDMFHKRGVPNKGKIQYNSLITLLQ